MYCGEVDRLNCHHPFYLRVVAKEGMVARTCAELHVAQPTIFARLRMLKESLGEKLCAYGGCGLALAEIGLMAYRYVDEIFSLGRDLMDRLKGSPTDRPASDCSPPQTS